MLDDASLYSKHRAMQIHDTQLFVDSIVKKMNWEHEEQDVIMDIGCGPGNSCKSMLLPAFPKAKKVIAMDVLPEMINFAKENNASEKIEYHVASIEDKSSIEKWAQQISKVISIYCFNWLDNQEEAFKNIYHVLKPGGEAALLFVTTTPFWDSFKMHIENPKWSKYLKNANPRIPESHFKKYDAPYYRSMLEKIGFKVHICEEEKREFAYPTDEDCRAAAYQRCGLTKYIPDEFKNEIKEELFQGFLKYNGRNADGRPVLHYTALSLLIKKPNV